MDQQPMATSSLPGLQDFVAEIGLGPIPSFVAADVLNKPIDIYHSYLAEIFQTLVGCDSGFVYDSIQPSNMAGNGDLDIVLPKLKLPSASPKELVGELLKKFQPHQRDIQRNIHDGWIKHQRNSNKTTLSYACLYCWDRRIFSTSDGLWKHAREAHRDKLPTEEEKMEAVRAIFEAESALKRPIKEDRSRKPTYNEDSTAGPEPPPAQKRPLSNPVQIAPLRSSELGYSVRQRGIKVLIQNRKDSAFGDTGAGQNVISDRRRKELGLTIQHQPTFFPMGNSKKIFSPGIVDVPIAFEDDPENIMTEVFHVVNTFAYDLLLGNPFLQSTKCLTKFIHRFVPCLFTLKSKWSFSLLGETIHRFEARLGKGLTVWGLPDIGSMRNVMNAEWAYNRAKAGGFDILTKPHNCGFVLLPDGTEAATVGQARTTVTLADGKDVPIVFELFPDCAVPVVFGQDFVFDHDIYTSYSTSLIEFDDPDSGDELMPMGYRGNESDLKKSKKRLADEDDRQLKWNLQYQDGRTASVEEWNAENTKREASERERNPSWQPGISLILHRPNTALATSSIGNGDTSRSSLGAHSTLSVSTNSSSSQDVPLDGGPGSSRNANLDVSQVRIKLASSCDPFSNGGSFRTHEPAQWQEERPG